MFAMLGFSQAEANSRFTIKNNNSSKIKVYVFNGNDSQCYTEAKTHTVGKGNEQSMGCAGGGEGRCKVRIYEKGVDSWDLRMCKNLDIRCDSPASILDNHSTLVVSDFSCEIVHKD